MIKKAQKILQETFGYETFRPLQEEVIRHVLEQKDTLVIMPTGGGKSLCYQIPALIFDGITIVVSPLISLMKDQVEQLEEFGVPALFLNSSLSPEEYSQNVSRLKSGEARLLYVAPETLLMPRTRELLSELNVSLFTIDEAHCISEWGHDFRPEYRQLSEVRKDFPGAVCLALTATATPRVREDIRKTLEMRESGKFIASFDRSNLNLKVVDKVNPVEQVLDFLYTRQNQSGIIYCFSRRQVDELYMYLEAEGYSVKPYHAGLSERERSRNQEAFIRDDIHIIVATIAFGMGINKPDVRFVIHYDMPQNIESYYQQIGRAGRDSLRSDCLLLYSYADRRKIQYFINQKEGQEKEIAEKHLKDLINFLETGQCRRVPLLGYFGETYDKDNCGMCDNCLRLKDDMEDLTVPAQKFLSCIVRTGELYGAYYIADILRGSKAKKILGNGHDKLSTYNIGREWSKDQWIQLSRLLIRNGILKKEKEHGSLLLQESAQKILKGEKMLQGVLDRTQTATAKAASKTNSEVENRYDEFLFEELRKKRKEIADLKDVPPYAIFPDTTLMEMSYYYPQSTDSLSTLYGVGDVKLKRFGKPFLDEIEKYCKEKNIDERKKGIAKKIRKTVGNKKHHLVGKDYNRGKGIRHLAEEHGVKISTILGHLKKFKEEGHPLEPDRILEISELSDRKRHEVIKSMDKVGYQILKPVYEDLDKSVDYNELRVMQLYVMAKE